MRRWRKTTMPKEIFDTEKFLELSGQASKCLIKKINGETKLKLRTGRYLYTIKLESGEAEKILSNIQCTKEEV